MKTLLMSIQEHVQKYVDMISAVFDVHVDVADYSKIRIAGTGRFNRMIGKPLYSGKVFARSMETGEMVFVKDPLTDPICYGCVNQNVCKNQCEMSFPIKLDNEVLGAICIASSNTSQYEMIISNTERLTLFMTNIIDLISLKAREYRDQHIQRYNLDLQEKLINLIRDGVIIIDNTGTVVFMNEHCEKLLDCKFKQIPYLTRIRQFSIQKKAEHENGTAEYEVKVRNARIRLVGTTYSIDGIEEGQMNTVFIFTDIRTIHENIIQNESAQTYTFSNILGQSPNFLDCLEQCRQAALKGSSTLLIGEPGVKKEEYARAMHDYSIRRNNQFIHLSHHSSVEKFIGQIIFHRGEHLQHNNNQIKSDILEGNTLYIAEIGDLTLGNQEVLLSILQNSKYNNTKVICSTSKDLKTLASRGDFNPNLFYLLEMNSIHIPALRTRGKDITLFINNFLQKYNQQFDKEIVFTKELYSLMLNYSWNGNIREVENVVSYIVEQTDPKQGKVTPQSLPTLINQRFQDDTYYNYNLESLEKNMIIKALNDFGSGSHSKARIAKVLGISNATLYRKLKQYGILQDTQYK